MMFLRAYYHSSIDAAQAFLVDAEAAFHVVCAATFDAGPDGDACREALRKIMAFGERGLNPIATMLVIRCAKGGARR